MRLRDDALGNLALKHEDCAIVPGWPRLDGEPGYEQRGGDVVGQVGDDAHWIVTQLGSRVEGERVRGDDIETSRVMFGNFLQGGERAVVALDRNHAGDAQRQ